MNIDLKYFSGTGNSYKILDTCRDIFVQNGCDVSISSITEKSDIVDGSDLIGFCFPVYAFGIPRICREYLTGLPRFARPVKAFVVITAGDPEEAGFSFEETNRILRKKGVEVIYSRVVHMPANWTVALNPPSKEEADGIIRRGVAQAERIARDILSGVTRHHKFNYPPSYSKLRFYKDYYLFKWLGVSYLWEDFRTDETCDGCGLCEKLCPTGSIGIVDETPVWAKTCEQCMRCVNYCPKQAIFQKNGGSVKGKNIYHEPTFKPLKLRRK